MYSVKELNIYPIKGLGGISVKTANALHEGFEFDRRWMVINEDGGFLSQRGFPLMALLKTSIDNDHLHVSYDSNKISIPLNEYFGDAIDVEVWGHQFKTQEVKATISQWFSNLLQKDVRLVRMTNVSSREKELKESPFKSPVSMADGYPFLVLGQASVDHLNSKLESPIKANRFRANILVESTKEHEEDEWGHIGIGEAAFKIIKPCARCSVITIEQETAIKGKEPLKTLAQYREKENKIYFGANAICTKVGLVSVDDVLKIV